MPYKERETLKRYYTTEEISRLLKRYHRTISFWVDQIGIKYKATKKDRLFTEIQVRQVERVAKWRQKGVSLKTIKKEKLYLKDEFTFRII